MALPDFAFIDGFDHYTEAGDGTLDISSLLLLDWNSTSRNTGTLSFFINSALSGNGASLQMKFAGPGGSGITTLRKTVPGNYARCIGGMTWKADLGNKPGVCFFDGTTAQLTIVQNTAGNIEVYRGLHTQTLLATSAESVADGSTHVLEWDITFDGAAGIIKIYLDGVATSIALTAQNTIVTANAYFNVFSLYAGSIGNTTFSLNADHLYVFCYSAAGGSETPELNNPIIQTDTASSDSATAQFTIGPSVLGKDYRTTTATNAPGANQLALLGFTPEANATLNSVSLMPATTSATAKFKAVLYADSAGSPGALIASGTEITGSTSGTALNLPFAAGQALTAGTKYWIGFIGNTSISLQEYSSTEAAGQKASNTYTSGAPNPAPAMTIGQPSWLIWGNMTGAASRFAQVNKAQPSLLEYNSDSVVGDKDLFNFPAMAVTPTSIKLVTIRAAALKSDGGARTINLDVKSGASTSSGSAPGQSPAISMGYLSSNFWNDPSSGVAWTAPGVNGALAGYEIAS